MSILYIQHIIADVAWIGQKILLTLKDPADPLISTPFIVTSYIRVCCVYMGLSILPMLVTERYFATVLSVDYEKKSRGFIFWILLGLLMSFGATGAYTFHQCKQLWSEGLRAITDWNLGEGWPESKRTWGFSWNLLLLWTPKYVISHSFPWISMSAVLRHISGRYNLGFWLFRPSLPFCQFQSNITSPTYHLLNTRSCEPSRRIKPSKLCLLLLHQLPWPSRQYRPAPHQQKGAPPMQAVLSKRPFPNRREHKSVPTGQLHCALHGRFQCHHLPHNSSWQL